MRKQITNGQIIDADFEIEEPAEIAVRDDVPKSGISLFWVAFWAMSLVAVHYFSQSVKVIERVVLAEQKQQSGPCGVTAKQAEELDFIIFSGLKK